MPRKSTSSTSAADPAISTPANGEGAAAAAGPSLDGGDTSMLSVMTDASTTTKARVNGKAAKEDADSLGVDDLLLPRTLTSRLARGILPANTSIQKDALLALTKAATVFISYLAHHANELTTKKTVGPQDVLKAIHEIEMGGVMGLGVVGPDGKLGGRLERELQVFESVVRGKRKGYREKVKARGSGGLGLNERGGDGDEDADADGGEEREAKRPRFEADGGDEDGNGQDGGKATTAQYQHQHDRPQQQQQQQHYSTAMPPPPPSTAHATNGSAATPHLPNHNTLPDDELEDEQNDDDDDDANDNKAAEDEDASSEDDNADEEEEEDEDEGDEDEEERQPDEEDSDGYGPDDQLRHDMNGGDVDEDDEDGDGEESGLDSD